MNDNHWYPRDPQRYLTDTQWCDYATEVAHVRLIDTYYALGKPIKDEPSRIQNIGKIKDADYNRVRGNLFELGWKIVEGFWRHKRIEETMDEMDAERNAKIKASTEGVRRRRELGQLPPVKSAVEPLDESHCEPLGNQRRTQPQPQPQPHIQPQPQPQPQPPVGGDGGPVELPVNFPKTVAEAKVAAAFVGCSEDFAEKVWNKASSRCGRDAKDIPIRSWRHYLTTEWNYEQSRLAEKAAEGQPVKKQRQPGIPTLVEIRTYCSEKWGDDDRRHGWVSGFYLYWNDEKRQWKRNAKVIDWKIEFTAQVTKWRSTT